jgi:hypothetical protein
MPPLPALRVSALARLADELRYSPPPAARRHVQRAEELLDKISDAQTYPEDFIVFAVTGFRPEIVEPALIPGAALRADLPPLIERLSVAAGWTRKDLGQGWVTAAEVCKAWKVSKKTLDRYRRRGLPARRVSGERGRTVILFEARRVRAFAAGNRRDLGKASRFSRIDASLAQRLVRRAERYRLWLGWSDSRIAARLGPRFGRSPEAIRVLLKREAGRRPPSGRLGASQRRLVERAVRLNVSMTLIASRLRSTVPSIHRAFWMRRVEMLRAMDLASPEAMFDGREGLVSEALAHPAATRNLGRPGAPNLLAHLRESLEAGWPDADEEHARAMAIGALLFRAKRRLAGVPRTSPRASELDAVQTDLLWAARLIAEQVRAQQMMVLRSVESRFARGLEDLPPAMARAAVVECAVVIADAARRFVPARSGAAQAPRLAAPAGLGVARVLARLAGVFAADLETVAGRAARRPSVLPGEVTLPDWTRRLTPWQVLIEPGPWARPSPDDQSARAIVLRSRFGFAPAPRPHTLAELALERRIPEVVAGRAVRSAVLDARRRHGA